MSGKYTHSCGFVCTCVFEKKKASNSKREFSALFFCSQITYVYHGLYVKIKFNLLNVMKPVLIFCTKRIFLNVFLVLKKSK